MDIRVLGAMEVLDPESIPLGGPTQRRTLGMLLVSAGQQVSIDQLVDAIWTNGDTPDHADRNVRKYVHRLRSSLGEHGDRVETVGTGYRLRLEDGELDADRFERLIDESRSATTEGDHGRALQLLDEALGLWRGRPYDDVADLDWARAEVVRLGELHASAIERRFDVLLADGRHTEVVGPLREAIGDEPWREARRVQLALALYRAGRQAEALRVISDFRSELVDELGLDPSPELAELEQRILEHDPTLMPASHQQHRLRDYELEAVIGEGAFSFVWRGQQPSLHRKVAVKQIRAELANQPDFIRRFETEAQTVAALEHPHIVPLYDYWREPDSAYLVMRYVAGGSLESAVLTRRLDEERLRRMVEQVGSALHTAHRAGVIHRDVKSANVLIDGDDNFYLTDFGIAFTGADEDAIAASLSTGSPAYASPEQLRRQELDHRADIYGFGITLFEAATGRLPFIDARSQAAMVAHQLEDPVPAPSSVDPGVPRWIDEIVARATAKSPADRYATMADLMAAVPALGTEAPLASATLVGELVNPFKALRAFREADAADYYGRDRLVARFLDVLSQPGSDGRMLAVVGPSGSGKSSAVRSGLLPRLRDGAVPGSGSWFIATMLPGSHPFDELESALTRVAARQPGPLVELMRDDPRGISRAVNQILPDEESELLLVIDQFEELFTHVGDDDRVRFLDGLLEAVREQRARLRVVVTIRADFWDRPLRHPGLAARLETAAVTVSPLAADELEAAIVEPVERQGASYEPGLVARIIADVGDQPGALPLLQYALTELFDANASGVIRSESYEAMGGLTGALAARAETTFDGMGEPQRFAARRLFGRLVTLGEGVEDTRRRVRVAELGDGDHTAEVIDAFGDARMLVFDHDPTTREPTVEIAHEALIRAWPRLRSWLDDDRDGLRIHRHLSDTTMAWLTSGRDAGELYRGGRLETAAAWSDAHRDALNPDERAFLDASRAAHEAELAAEREHLEQQVRSNRRLRVLVAVAAVVATIAAVSGSYALRQRASAEDKAAEAAARAIEAEEATQVAEAALMEAEGARAAADSSARAAAEQREAADLQRMRSDALLLAEQARATVEPDAALAMLVAVEVDRLASSLAGKDTLHRALTAGAANWDQVSAGNFSPLEETIELPADQLASLEDSAARLFTAVLNGGDTILTSVEVPGGTSTVVRHDRVSSSQWESTDTGIEAIVTNSGDFTTWVSEDRIVVRGADDAPLGAPIPRPADLLSFTLSENGQVLVLGRGGGRIDVYRSSGDLIATDRVPDAAPDSEFAVSVLGDGSMVAAFSLYERIGPWALWSTEPFRLETYGTSGFGFGPRDNDPSIDRPLLNGGLLYSDTEAGDSQPVDPATREPVDDRRFPHDGRLLALAESTEHGLVAGASVSTDDLMVGGIRVWDAGSAEVLGQPIPVVTPARFADLATNRVRYDVHVDAARRVIVPHRDRIAIWNYDTSTWADVACAAAGRNMSRSEWEDYGPTGVEYRETCAQYAIAS